MHCPVCRITGPVNARFCFQCGQALDAPPPLPVAEPESLHVATVLAAQVIGLPADEAGLVGACFRALAEAIGEHGGVVVDLAADRLVASFGLPLSAAAHAPQAALAALAMQARFEDDAGQFADFTGANLALRIALHSGAVWQDRRADGLVVSGETVAQTGALCQLARPSQILISETTHRLVREHVLCSPLAMALERHLDRPLSVYELGVPRQAGTVAEAHQQSLIGRQREMEQFLAFVQQSRDGRGMALGITGEAGLGKTRLIHELRTRLDGRAPHWLDVRAQAWSQQRPNTIFIDVLSALLELAPGEDPLVIQARLAQRLHDLDRQVPDDQALSYPRRVALLSHLFGVPLTDSAEATAVREETAVAVRQMLLQEARRVGHLVVAFDDMHWADPVSVKTLVGLLGVVAEAPLLLVIGYRSNVGVSERLRGATPHFHELLLEPLDRDETDALMIARLPHLHLSAGVRAQILDATQGNPYYIEEVLKALTENGGLSSDDEQWVTTARFSLPQTVRDLAATRLDGLGGHGKQVLQVASVLGRSFAAAALRDLLPAVAVDEVLTGLIHGDLIVSLGGGRHIFRHNLTQEVAYATLDEAEKAHWHGEAARWLERQRADRLADVLELLAWHYSRAGIGYRPQALGYLLRAAERAKQQGGVTAALDHWQQALALGTEALLPPEARARILSQMGEMYLLIGETDRALTAYQDALKLVGSARVPVVRRQA